MVRLRREGGGEQGGQKCVESHIDVTTSSTLLSRPINYLILTHKVKFI